MIEQQDNQENDSAKTEVFTINYPQIPDLEVCCVLGKGGSGTVYKGRQAFLKRDVAIKVLNVSNGTIDDAFVERFHREVQILADLIHPHIVSCFQAGVTCETEQYPQSPYLAMEYVDGPSLQAWIRKQGKINEVKALEIIENIADALAYAQKKSIIHRDIKAENILLKPEPDGDAEQHFIPKLADLGIARSTDPQQGDNLTIVGTMIGTPSSMAPEQFNEPNNVDFKADIYGLGCVFFHMVTGKKPYEGFNLTEMVIKKNSTEPLDPKELNAQLHKQVVLLITSMMAKDKSDRPESYADLIHQCQAIRQKLLLKSTHNVPAGKIYSILSVSVVLVLLLGLVFLLKKDEHVPVEPETVSSVAQKKPTATDEPEVSEIAGQEKIVKNNKPNELTNNDIPVISEQKTEQPVNILKTTLLIQYEDKDSKMLLPGELFNLKITALHDAYVYCYFENQQHEIVRFFPNRFEANNFLVQDSSVILPGDMPFELGASADAINERIACFFTREYMQGQLPEEVLAKDFENLSVSSLEQVGELFSFVNESKIPGTFFTIQVRK